LRFAIPRINRKGIAAYRSNIASYLRFLTPYIAKDTA